MVVRSLQWFALYEGWMKMWRNTEEDERYEDWRGSLFSGPFMYSLSERAFKSGGIEQHGLNDVSPCIALHA